MSIDFSKAVAPDETFEWGLYDNQVVIDRIGHELALEELARLSPEERAEVARYAEHVHYDTHHGPYARGIYTCHINPRDPREVWP